LDQMLTFGDYLSVIRRRLGWIVASMVVCMLLAYAYSKHQGSKYEATSTVVITSVVPPSFLGGSGGSSSTTIDRIVATDATLADSLPVATLAVQQAGMAQEVTGDQLLGASSVVPDTSANALHFTASSSNADNAVKLANGYAAAYQKSQADALAKSTDPVEKSLTTQIQTLVGLPSQGAKLAAARAELDQLRTYVTTVKAQTTAPNPANQAKQVQPKTSRNLLMGAAFGLAIGLILAFVIQASDDRIYSVRQFARLSRLPIIGKLPPLRALRGRRIDEAPELLKEQVRTVAARLTFARNASHASTLLVSSADPIGGSVDLAAWMAWGLADLGNRVVLLNVDTAHAQDAASLLGLPVQTGETADADGVVVPLTGSGTLMFLTLGSRGTGPLTVTPDIQLLVQRAREEADVVLINAPAITVSSTAVVLTELADAVVVTARLPRTRRPDVARLLDALSGIPTPTLGAIVVGGEDYAEPEFAPPVAPSGGARTESRSSVELGQWAGDVVSQRR
jgi:capsular polysaccharide biosynthesis protein